MVDWFNLKGAVRASIYLSTPQILTWTGLGQARALSLALPPSPMRRAGAQALVLPPNHIKQRAGAEHTARIFNWCSHVGCWHYRRPLNLLQHNVSPHLIILYVIIFYVRVVECVESEWQI